MNRLLEPASALLKKSWERSRRNGVNASTAKDAILEEAQFRSYWERKEEFIRMIDPTLEHLAHWLKRSYSIVVLCDTSGYILDCKGDPVFLKDTEKIQVHRGACWSEQVRGTNSAGTVIIEQKPLAVVGKEHYLDINHMLYCAASPIFDPYGELLAVFDLSGHCERYHPSLLGMVDVMARKIEDWLLIHRPERQVVISLYPNRSKAPRPARGQSGRHCNRRQPGGAAVAEAGQTAIRPNPADRSAHQHGILAAQVKRRRFTRYGSPALQGVRTKQLADIRIARHSPHEVRRAQSRKAKSEAASIWRTYALLLL
ncbi:GAF domain-containing protein [Brevibacillus massiliensis]|uniref:GAF domain-containing protein n=1 Tax=Brevibacillus massiliensis TaxID=1118054 RepID=UPI0021C4A31B|nr:GAF domain-containing protein [Brevibacillus massiliensis]